MFIAAKSSKITNYYKVHDFFNLEEVNQPILQIYSNIKSVDFYDLQPLTNKSIRQFSRMDCFFQREYFAKDIIFGKYLEVVDVNKFLLNLSSLKLKLKFIMELEV